jgi:hypothetical protein
MFRGGLESVTGGPPLPRRQRPRPSRCHETHLASSKCCATRRAAAATPDSRASLPHVRCHPPSHCLPLLPHQRQAQASRREPR